MEKQGLNDKADNEISGDKVTNVVATDDSTKSSADALDSAALNSAASSTAKTADKKSAPDSVSSKPSLGSAKKTSTGKTSKGFSWITSFFLLLVIAGLGASGYAHWWQYQQNIQQQTTLLDQTQQLSQQVSQKNTALSNELNQTRQTLTQLQNDLARLLEASKQNQQQQIQTQQQLTQQLEAQNQRLLKLSSVNSQNWELAEALYLTRLAGQRLVMESNREAALALLMGAEEIIGRQQNPDLYKVREAITNDITALKLVEAVDKEGLFLQLSALNGQIQQLPLTESLNFEKPTLEQFDDGETKEDLGFWGGIAASFDNTLNRLQGYIRKTELQSPIKPLLMPEEQQQIRLSMTLFIESAQLALLRDQNLVFNNALAQAQTQLDNYYPESNQRNELILALESLQSSSIARNFPDISGSYRQLNAFIQDHSTQKPPAQKSPGPAKEGPAKNASVIEEPEVEPSAVEEAAP